MLLCMPKRTPTAHTAEVASSFAQWLRRRREQAGMTQEELAHRAGLSRNQVQNLENNRNNNATGRSSANPSLDTILALEAAFGLELGDLLVDVRRFMESSDR
ncbi:helix-turn-helix transcriptional regulator [Aeromicrobium tamlense]|jgi:transcriptional regulator with XRE-family HTH domain|uniref:Helix-turn-helix transcriptional regulator n=2 Tax=Aeromicrobium tamlense TaxID=375541 RepID=A0A8I0FSJ4_9ACTN|nr:helix-turn-helix transcriptional regulator [Aeromicrobium tamlense]